MASCTSHCSRTLTIDASHLNLDMGLANKLAFGTVNANRRHCESGAMHLQAIEGHWPGLLGHMITRRIPWTGSAPRTWNTGTT